MDFSAVAELTQPFTRDEAATRGLTRHQIDLACRRGVLVRIARGLYAATDPWNAIDRRDEHLAIARAAHRQHPEAVLSHVSAAIAHGLPNPAGPLGHSVLTVLDASTFSRHPWIDLRHGALPPEHVGAADDGLPLTSVAWTVVDCFRSMRLHDAVAVADDALRRGQTTPSAIRDVRLRQRRWPGVAATAEGFRLIDGRRESWLESASAVVMQRWGVPRAIPQVNVVDMDGALLGRVDALWPQLGVVGEADGEGKFLGDPALGLDSSPHEVGRRLLGSYRRAEGLRGAGLGVVRWTRAELLRQPAVVVARWRRAAAAAEPGRVRAAYRCSCCGRPLTDCSFVPFPAR